MRKRLLSILLTVCMVFGMLPQMAFANEIPNGYTDGGDVGETGLDLRTAPSDNTYFKAGDGYILWNGTDTLTLNNATIDTTSGSAYALTLKDYDNVTIVAEGDNVLVSNTCGLAKGVSDIGNIDGVTVIKGSGTLAVTSRATGYEAGDYAICINIGSLEIKGGVTVIPVNENTGCCILAYINSLSILEDASLVFTNNTSTVENSICAANNITINTTGKVEECSMVCKEFNYYNGTLAAWVLRSAVGSSVHTVYNNYTLKENKTIEDYYNENEITVMEGATLTINNGVTLEVQDRLEEDGVPQITNKGTIVNNGTIQFPATYTDDMLSLLTATENATFKGSGKIMRGYKEVAVIDGKFYEVEPDAKSTIGLDLATSTPTSTTCYKAGSGYILWEPSSGKVTLQNASINTANIALFLPDSNITVVVVGENSLVSTGNEGIFKSFGDASVQGSGTLNVQGQNTCIYNGSGNLTLTEGVSVISTGYGIDARNVFINGNANVTAKMINGGNVTIDTQGIVNVEEMILGSSFNYVVGTITGSWIIENTGGYALCDKNTVYGNVVLNNDKYIQDNATVEKGLTVKEGATLTINPNVTLTVLDRTDKEGVPHITNNGTIINNGTIKFPAVTTGAEIQALNITGNGTIMIGDKAVISVNGVMYPFGGNVSMAGVDLTVDTPTVDTYYAASNGYMIFSPSNKTLTMNNAEITAEQAKPIITLPTSDIKLVLEGENKLTNISTATNFAPAIQQGQLLDVKNTVSAIAPQAYSITVSGDGSLATITKSENHSISTDGTFVMESGTLKGGNTVDNCFGIETVDFKMTGGSLKASLGLSILGNALVEGGTIFTPGNSVNYERYGKIYCIGNFEMTGGTVTCGAAANSGLIVYNNFIKTGGTLNALVATVEANGATTFKPYGDAPMVYYDNNGNERGGICLFLGNIIGQFPCKLNIPSGSTLTIPKDAVLNVSENMAGLRVSDYATNNGSLVNNGKIVLLDGSTQDYVKAALEILKPTGTGMVEVFMGGTTAKYYTNSGEPINTVPSLTLDTTEASGDGYEWTGNATDGFTLLLDNLVVTNDNIVLPSGVPVVMVLNGNTVVEGRIGFSGGDASNLTIGGSGTITMNGGIGSPSANGGRLTIQDQATVTVGSISLFDLINHNGTLIVDGKEAYLSVTGESGARADTVQLLNGAQMTVRSEEIGVVALYGGVSVTGGSILNVGCDYGVYIVDGKLTVDKTSKLITNGAVAPFCVVDTSNAKAQSDMVSLPGVPSGTSITSATGSSGKYWSLVSKGGTLGVTEVNYGVATLSGAATGILTFAFTKKSSSDDSTSGGGSASISSKYTITAKAEKGGNISPDGEVSVSKNADKTFTITPNKGYEVKDVLIDGVSVGKVKEYTFDDVTKAHTITATFAEVKEEAKEEVKEEKSKEGSFSDVKENDWFKKAVDYVTEKGLMSGTSDKEFAPNLSTTRGMIVTILWRLEGQPSAKAKANFTDVGEGEYYAEAVAWASENNIVGGYGNGLFGPNDVITREQMASVLYRYSKFKGYDTTQSGTAVGEFSDYSKLSSWAGESTSWAVNAGLISGTGNGQLDPQGSATRGQVASILMRYCEDVAK